MFLAPTVLKKQLDSKMIRCQVSVKIVRNLSEMVTHPEGTGFFKGFKRLLDEITLNLSF